MSAWRPFSALSCSQSSKPLDCPSPRTVGGDMTLMVASRAFF
jgi:hypothetical protein